MASYTDATGAAALVRQVRGRIGGQFPISPGELAASIPLLLEQMPHGCACEVEVHSPEVPPEYRGIVRYPTCTDDVATEDDAIASGCALWLVDAWGLAPDPEVIAYVVRELCGTPGLAVATLRSLAKVQPAAPVTSAPLSAGGTEGHE